jgi:ATP-binding cassette subfamily B protein
VLVDGVPLDEAAMARLRRQTAWLDPGVQLWNKSLISNLRYGANNSERVSLDSIIEQADLTGIMQRLANGLQTKLGENGGLVSGGEGQRVRFGRSLGRENARLVILDEPFRGLPRVQRQKMLEEARKRWSSATLLYVSHDIHTTLDFPRVLVVHDGRLVEDLAVSDRANAGSSHFGELLRAEDSVRNSLWSTSEWRQLEIANGKLTERKWPE